MPVGFLLVDHRDVLWVATLAGLNGWPAAAATPHPMRGPAAEVSSILLDRQRNLWVSTFHHGLYRVSRDLVVTFATDSVLREPLLRLAECPGGALAGITASGTPVRLLIHPFKVRRQGNQRT